MRTASAAISSHARTIHPAGAREAPGAVHEDPDPEALGLAEAEALDLSGLHVGALLPTPDDAHVGVGRAEMRGRVEGATRVVIHGCRQRSKALDGLGPGIRDRTGLTRSRTVGLGPLRAERAEPGILEGPEVRVGRSAEGLVERGALGERGDEPGEPSLPMRRHEVVDGRDALGVGQAEAAGAGRELARETVERDEGAGTRRALDLGSVAVVIAAREVHGEALVQPARRVAVRIADRLVEDDMGDLVRDELGDPVRIDLARLDEAEERPDGRMGLPAHVLACRRSQVPGGRRDCPRR